MSHNLSTNKDGITEMFCAGGPAWHGLGRNVKEAQTWEDAIKLAALDWTISKKQLKNPVTGNLIPSWAIIRDDDGRWLHTAGKDYTCVQNIDLFSFTNALIGEGIAKYVSAGALGDGERVWCLASLNGMSFEPVKGDLHETYLLFTDHRAGKSSTIKLTTTRVVCQNTLNLALHDKGDIVSLRHVKNIADRIETVKRIASNANNQITAIKDRLKILSTKPIDKPKFSTIMEKLFPGYEKAGSSQNRAAAVAQNFMFNDGNKIKGIEGTAYALLQACTRWVDHQKDNVSTKSTTVEKSRAESAMFGTGDAFKNRALEVISSVVGHDDIDKILADAIR